MTEVVILDGQDPCVTKSVTTGPMVWAVSTTVVGTVWTTLRVTNGPDIVTGDVIRDIQRATVAKSVHLDDLDCTAVNIVMDIV